MIHAPIEIFSPGTTLERSFREKHSADLMRRLFAVFNDWEISSEDALFLMGHPPFMEKWIENDDAQTPFRLPSRYFQRFSVIVDLHRLVCERIPDRDIQKSWLHEPNLMSGMVAPITLIGTRSTRDILAYHRRVLASFDASTLSGQDIRIRTA